MTGELQPKELRHVAKQLKSETISDVATAIALMRLPEETEDEQKNIAGQGGS